MSNYIRKGIKRTCLKFKGRSVGSESETNCQKYFSSILSQWTDSVIAEEFDLQPKAFLGWIPLCAVTALLSLCFCWIGIVSKVAAWCIAAVVLALFAFLMLWFEFFRYRRFVDFLFPKKTSHNVYAVRNSTEAPERRIILGGHADAAYEYRYIHLWKGKLAMPIVIASIIGIVTLLVGSVVLFLLTVRRRARKIQFIIAAIVTAFSPVFAACLFFINWNVITDGANDNLSGCYAAFAVMKYLADNNIRFEHTEVCCLITGGEEAGLRGAAAFAKAHKKELSDIESVFIAMDTLREPEQLMVYTNGMYGFQRSSKQAGKLLQNAAKELEIELKAAPPYPGAMDSDAFSREGLIACGLGAVDHNPQSYYHTRMDTAENIDPELIDLCADICIKAIEQYDKAGLPSK